MPLDNSTNGASGFDFSQLVPLLGGLGSLGSSIYTANQQDGLSSLARGFANATGTLNPYTASTGAGGISAGWSPTGPTFNYGSLQNPYTQLTGLAGGQFGSAGGIQAPNGLNSGINGAFGQANTGLAGFNPGAAGLAGNNAFLGAANAAQAAGGGYSNQVKQQYAALQGLHADSDKNAFNNLQSSLFGNGQLGASSGALQTTAFAKGLGMENTQDAVNASQLGLQAQASDTNTASQLGGLGQGLLNSAFSNFGQTAQLGPNIAGGYLNNGLGAIQGAGNITQQGLGLFNAGLQGSLGQNQASARAGSLALGNSQLANDPRFAGGTGNLLTGLFGSLATSGGQQGGGGSLQSLLKGGKSLYDYFAGAGGYGASAGELGSLGSELGASTGSAMSGVAGDVAAANDAWLGGSGGALSSAGGGAAGAAGAAGAGAGAAGLADVTGSLGAGLDAAAASSSAAGGGGAAGSGASAAGGSSALSSFGAAALPAAAAALAIAAPLYGLTQPAYSMSGKYWGDMGNMLGKGRPTDASGQYSYDAGVGELTTSAQRGDPAAIALANQYGIPWQTAGNTPANYINYSMPGGAGRSQSIVTSKK